MKAVAAVKEDKAKALDMFNKGERRIPGPGPLCIVRKPSRPCGKSRAGQKTLRGIQLSAIFRALIDHRPRKFARVPESEIVSPTFRTVC
jgi:hypothetical protein